MGVKLIKKTLSFLLVVILILSCNESGTDPIDNTEPGRRDYVWTIDTISTPALWVSYVKIWGASPDDVWVVGAGSFADQTILRYNGENWDIYNNGKSYYCNSLLGFASDDIWIGSHDGKIYHYDGNEISLFQTVENSEGKKFLFQDLWGSQPNNIIAVGSYRGVQGVITTFNGAEWQIKYETDFECQFGEVDMALRSNPEYFIYVSLPEDSGGVYTYHNNELNIIKIGYKNDFTSPIVNILDEKAYICWEGKMYRYINGEFELFLDLSYIDNFTPRVWGRNENDFFFTLGKNLYHYNGENVQVLLTTEENDILDIRDACLFDDEVFLLILNYKNSYRYVFRGKLN